MRRLIPNTMCNTCHQNISWKVDTDGFISFECRCSQIKGLLDNFTVSIYQQLIRTSFE